MRAMLFGLAAVFAVASASPAFAQMSERERLIQSEQQRIERAKENCRLNSGVDCDTPQGLQEWLLYERTRMEAVLDRELPPPER